MKKSKTKAVDNKNLIKMMVEFHFDPTNVSVLSGFKANILRLLNALESIPTAGLPEVAQKGTRRADS